MSRHTTYQNPCPLPKETSIYLIINPFVSFILSDQLNNALPPRPPSASLCFWRIYTGPSTYPCICIYVSKFPCFYVSMFLCFYVSMFPCFYVSMFLCLYVSMFLCLYVSMFLCLYVSMFLCFYVVMFRCFYVSMFLCFYVSMFLCSYVSVLDCFYDTWRPTRYRATAASPFCISSLRAGGGHVKSL